MSLPRSANRVEGRSAWRRPSEASRDQWSRTSPCSSTTSPSTASTPSRELKRTRARHTKHRSGCSGCKTRHVKCDETRPACKRCVRLGIECEGLFNFEAPARKPLIQKKTAPSEPQNVVANDAVWYPTPPPNNSPPQSSPPQSGPSFLPGFSNEDDARYFHFYCKDVSGDISGAFRTSLWDRLIPQMGNSDSVIRHAVIALGALSKSRLSVALAVDAPHSAVSNPHLQRALRHYGKALREMASVRSSAQSQRNVLMSCLLFYCIETLQGQTIAATAHASNGANLLYRWCIDHRLPAYDPVQYERKLNIEEDLCSAFGNLDMQALQFLDNRSSVVHRGYQKHLDPFIEHMPGEFASLDEAHRYLHHILRRNLHAIAAIRQEIGADAPAGDMGELLNQSYVDCPPGSVLWCHSGKPTPTVPYKTQRELEHCKKDITRWRSASSSLFEKHFSTSVESPELFLVIVLTIQAAANIVTLASTLSPPETVYDRFMPEFLTITRLASSLYAFQGSAAVFQFPIAIIPGLMEVGLRCRDPTVRGQAIDLLLAEPGYQEGLWHGKELGMFLYWVKEKEERGIDKNGYVPASSRISWVSSRVSIENRRTEINYLQWSGTETGDFVQETAVIKW